MEPPQKPDQLQPADSPVPKKQKGGAHPFTTTARPGPKKVAPHPGMGKSPEGSKASQGPAGMGSAASSGDPGSSGMPSGIPNY